MVRISFCLYNDHICISVSNSPTFCRFVSVFVFAVVVVVFCLFVCFYADLFTCVHPTVEKHDNKIKTRN